MLTAEERAIHEWQLDIPGFGEAAQEKLKGATALVSRCGGLGGPVCFHLAAAGIGKLMLAHGGNLQPSDLNRQILMTHAALGTSRVECAARRLREFKPTLDVEAVPENISPDNAEALISRVDIVFDCAPLFSERFAMNRACVTQRKPMVEAAMYSMEASVTTILPGRTPCLACLFPEDPPRWRRRFPVLGAVSALAGSLAALEGIKILIGWEPSLASHLLHVDARTMLFEKIPIARDPACPVCGGLG